MSECEYRTKSGKIITDAEIEALAEEAERGYDLEKFQPLTDDERATRLRQLKQLNDTAGRGVGDG